ncbi:hypothetical protein [Gimesia algae]|uniref:Uncharacterized protein n=1 Tax=Gimesia algae TaxID=2527971 RepID=A0A517VMZ2_9PLAN|nr:hypothetical protein [Gimesia algae]QDT94280.1 hypothetical protein Pan161_59750 [Gimesia algae]
MFEKFGPEEWQLVVMVGLSIISGIGAIVLAIAAWTLKYIIDVEKNTSSSAASTTAMASSLESLKSDNEKDHDILHGRIKDVETVQVQHGETLVEHSLKIKGLEGGC